jgi:hypothetical protein
MPDTKGRPGSLNWIKTWFPEYIVNGKPIVLKAGWGRKRTAQTSPWAWAPNEFNRVNIYGYIATPVPGGWYNQILKTPVDDEAYAEFMRRLNYYSNGHLTFGGLPGLDPVELIGGYRGKRQRGQPRIYHCPNGIYTPVSTRYGIPARFVSRGGNEWLGDPPGVYIPTWT